MITGLESIIGLAILLGGAGIVAGAGGTIAKMLVDYMIANKACNTAVNVTDKVVTGFGRNPLPPGGGRGGGDDDEDAEKKTRLHDILVKEYGMYPVNISIIPRTGMIAQISVDSPKRLDANNLRYLASKMGLPVAITYVRVCTECGATAQPEVERCINCGTSFTAKTEIRRIENRIDNDAIPEISKDLRKLVNPTEFLIVDGSNLATMKRLDANDKRTALFWTLETILEQMEGHAKGCKIFVGSSFRHIVNEPEAFKQLEAEGKILSAHGGQVRVDDDDIILYHANERNAVILTNDVYAKEEAFDKNNPEYDSEEMKKARNRAERYPWILNRTRFIGHVVDPTEKQITFYRHMPTTTGSGEAEPTIPTEPKIQTSTVEIPEQEKKIQDREKALPPEPPRKRPVCPKCQSEVGKGDYCNQCGEPLVDNPRILVDDTCPSCGGAVDRWTLRCRGCGTQHEAWICDRCSSPIDAGDERCQNCGVGLIWGTFTRNVNSEQE
jgi:hypothetical protein